MERKQRPSNGKGYAKNVYFLVGLENGEETVIYMALQEGGADPGEEHELEPLAASLGE